MGDGVWLILWCFYALQLNIFYAMHYAGLLTMVKSQLFTAPLPGCYRHWSVVRIAAGLGSLLLMSACV